MKCQNCGKNEVKFHYSSNVNGCVTEAALCAVCAEKSGYSFRGGSLFNGDMLAGFFPEFFGMATNPRFGFAPTWQFAAPPQVGILQQAQSGQCACGTSPLKPTTCPGVDEEMKKRREISAMREEMRMAARRDDFERAAELRDRIKQMEEGSENEI